MPSGDYVLHNNPNFSFWHCHVFAKDFCVRKVWQKNYLEHFNMKAVRFKDLGFEDDLLNFILVFRDSYWANKVLLVQSSMEGRIQWDLFIIELINTTLFSCGYSCTMKGCVADVTRSSPRQSSWEATDAPLNSFCLNHSRCCKLYIQHEEEVYPTGKCWARTHTSLCDFKWRPTVQTSVHLRSPYDPLGATAGPKPLCSSSAITDMCLKSAGWWLNVSINRYVSCLCEP